MCLIKYQITLKLLAMGTVKKKVATKVIKKHYNLQPT